MSPRAPRKSRGKKPPEPPRPRQTLLLDAFVDKLTTEARPGTKPSVPPLPPLPPKPAPARKPTAAAAPPPPAQAPAPAPPPQLTEVKDGIYPGTPYDQYDTWDRMNHSILHLFNRSPLHARAEQLLPSKPTKAMAFGHAAHCIVLEPGRFETDFVQAPMISRRSNAGKAAFAVFEEAHKGRTILLPDEYSRCEQLATAAAAHPLLRRLMGARGVNEVGLAWTDAETEVQMKSRLDRLTVYTDGWPTIVDLKTANDASAWAFGRAVHTYSYHQQAAVYLDGAAALAPVDGDRRYVFVVIESDPPFAIAVYELDVAAIEQGRDEYKRNLRTLVRCRETGNWPGYTEEEAGLVGLPSYAMRAVAGAED